MEDDKGYVYKKSYFYKDYLYLYCVNKYHKALKCPANVKVHRNGEMHFIKSHSPACMMERLRKSRGILRKKPKKSRQKRNKAPAIPLRVPTKKFNKVTLEEYFAPPHKEENKIEINEPFEELNEELTTNVIQETPVDSQKIKNEIAETFKKIEERKKKKKLQELDKYMFKKI